ncbi:MAG: hypothetical protein IJX30_00490 [Clostridia bacterium]|nr:hypothetical protein [Clostridia bacterium]
MSTQNAKKVEKSAETEQKETTDHSSVDNSAPKSLRYSIEKKNVRSGMSEEARYEILKNKKILLTAKADNAKLDSILSKLERDGNNISYESVKMRDRIKLFKKIGEEFGVFKEYENKDISLSFEYSKGSMEESAYKQKRDFNSFVKMLTCFDVVIENAVGIETHNRNEQGYKPDMTLKEVYVLASAFVDDGEIVPVKLEVKEFTDKKNKLYITIALESIKKDEIIAQGNTNDGVTQYPTSSTISIAGLAENVNTKDENFIKYFPDGFLDDEKKEIKRKALEKDRAKSRGRDGGKIDKPNQFDQDGRRASQKTERTARNFLDVNARKTEPKEAMRQYLHRIDLTQETKEALREKYGEETARRIINIWDNTSGKAGVDMSTVTRELADKGVYIDGYLYELAI